MLQFSIVEKRVIGRITQSIRYLLLAMNNRKKTAPQLSSDLSHLNVNLKQLL